MAKNRRSRQNSEREVNTFANSVASEPKLAWPTLDPRPSAPKRQVEDNRTFHPEGKTRAPRKLSGTEAKITAKPYKRPPAKNLQAFKKAKRDYYALREKISFADPQHVLVCIRRKTRKQVLHALRKLGRGRGKPRRSWRSNIRC